MATDAEMDVGENENSKIKRENQGKVKKRIIKRVVMMGAMLLGMLDVGYAQQQRYERPDFKLCFDILRKNRAISK